MVLSIMQNCTRGEVILGGDMKVRLVVLDLEALPNLINVYIND